LLTVMTGYYAAVVVKMLLVGVLTIVTVRSATVHATILLGLMFAANLKRNSAMASEPAEKPKSCVG
jgi:hypothetical protein